MNLKVERNSNDDSGRAGEVGIARQAEGKGRRRSNSEKQELKNEWACSLTNGVNRRYRSGALRGDEESERMVGRVTHRGSVRVERWVRPPLLRAIARNVNINNETCYGQCNGHSKPVEDRQTFKSWPISEGLGEKESTNTCGYGKHGKDECWVIQ